MALLLLCRGASILRTAARATATAASIQPVRTSSKYRYGGGVHIHVRTNPLR